MMKYTLEQAVERINELEKENHMLRQELENLQERKPVGRKVHDEKWMKAYNEFVSDYESGMTIENIAKKGDVSKRTAYRYLAYYKELNKL